MMRRRDFIVGLGAATCCPLHGKAQQLDRKRRVGVLMGSAETQPESRARFEAFRHALAALGWNEDSNLILDVRWSAGDATLAGFLAKEIVAQKPDAILTETTPPTAAVRRETNSIPIVFAVVSDPVGSGFVKSLPRPGGNATGFVNIEFTFVQKWVELLKEIAPNTTQVAVMFNPQTATYVDYYLGPMRDIAAKLGVKVLARPVESENEIANAITELAQDQTNGLITMTDIFMYVHRQLVIELTTLHKIPNVGFMTDMTVEGGLISYSTDIKDLMIKAAAYIDRILRGAHPSDLPVQIPTKFQLAINLKTAQALGLNVPPTLLARADEVIE